MVDEDTGLSFADRVDLHLGRVLSLPMQREVGRDHLSSSHRSGDNRESQIILPLRDLPPGWVEADVVTGMSLILEDHIVEFSS